MKPGAVVIDSGINFLSGSSKKSGYRLVGDVAYQEVSQVAGYITTVPGGVGPMTVTMLMHNTLTSTLRRHQHNTSGSVCVFSWIFSPTMMQGEWNLSLLALHPLSSLPSDIEVARAQTPKSISLLASEIGLLQHEDFSFASVQYYGTYSNLQPDDKYVAAVF